MKLMDNKRIVQSRSYRLVKPHEVVEVLIEHDYENGQVIVEPSIASICHADLRYYSGNRRAEALEKKLPMALIHEGLGTIVESSDPALGSGQRVVVVPNIPGYRLNGINREDCCPACRSGIGDNYCHNGRFLGSGMDGIAQHRLVIPSSCAVPIPDEVPDEIAVLTELCTVSYQALSPIVEQLRTARVAVFGDGPVGYLAAAVLRHLHGVGSNRLHVFGADVTKLAKFDFAERHLVQEYDFTSGEQFDIAVECAGGKFSESAINQAIDIVRPCGHLILMGVSEERVPINTRDVLEKGITMRGSSRSSSSDFHRVIEAMKDLSFQATLRKLLPEEVTKIASAEQFSAALQDSVEHRGWKKVLLHFTW